MLYEFICPYHPGNTYHTDSTALEYIEIIGDSALTCPKCGSLLLKTDITPKMATLEEVKANKPKRRRGRKSK